MATIPCPVCQGALHVPKHARTVKCRNCGQKYIVKRKNTQSSGYGGWKMSIPKACRAVAAWYGGGKMRRRRRSRPSKPPEGMKIRKYLLPKPEEFRAVGKAITKLENIPAEDFVMASVLVDQLENTVERIMKTLNPHVEEDTMRGEARSGEARRGLARPGAAGLGGAGRGEARQGVEAQGGLGVDARLALLDWAAGAVRFQRRVGVRRFEKILALIRQSYQDFSPKVGT